MKKIAITLLALLLVACGAPVNTTQLGYHEATGVQIIADTLIGKVIFVDGEQILIKKGTLDRFQMGIAGSKNSELEGMDVLFLELEQGNHSLVLTDNGVILFEKEVYLSNGQVKELRIK